MAKSYSDKFVDVMRYSSKSLDGITTQRQLREFFEDMNGNKAPQDQGYLSRLFIEKLISSKKAAEIIQYNYSSGNSKKDTYKGRYTFTQNQKKK